MRREGRLGFTAQDFYAALDVGHGDKHIGTLGAYCLALAAIQGLHQALEEKDAQIAKLEAGLGAIKQNVLQQRK